jgi:hypothetical protein
MGAPTSPILAETYMQHRDHKHIYTNPIKKNQQIIAYFRYDNDIFIIFDQNKTNTEQIQQPTTIIHKIYCRERTTWKDQLLRSHNTSQRQKGEIFNIQDPHTDQYYDTQ